MFLPPWKPKTTVFTVFFASDSRHHGIYTVFWPGPGKNTGIYTVFSVLLRSCFMPKAQKRYKLQCYRGFSPYFQLLPVVGT